MNTQELKARYNELYADMEQSKDVSKMKAFGVAFTALFNKFAEVHPDIAEVAIEMLSMIEYNNFVTKEEAIDISSSFINDDMTVTGSTEHTKGAHWSMDALKTFLEQKGLPTEEKPSFNWYALWLTVNMVYSDYADAFVSLLGRNDNETIAVASYTFALKKLKDLDRPKFIRAYFHLDA